MSLEISVCSSAPVMEICSVIGLVGLVSLWLKMTISF
jgi:hypothetical protein